MNTKPVSIVACALAFAFTVGCQPKSQPADVTMRTTSTTQPSMRDRAAGRHVELMVRDQTSAALANSLIGRKCRVQLRRDALGMATNSPAPLTGRWAMEASVTGTVIDMSDQWLVIEATPPRRVVIPHASILFIELTD